MALLERAPVAEPEGDAVPARRRTRLHDWAVAACALGFLLFAALLAQVVTGSESSLTNAAAPRCGGFHVGFGEGPRYNPVTRIAEVSAITVSGLTSTCAGRTITVQPQGAAGALGSAQTVVVQGQTEIVARFATPIDAAAVQNVSVTAS